MSISVGLPHPPMKILGIESSCDDTSVALIEATEEGFFVIAEKTASQIEVHKKYGGVVPEIAGRMHAENIFPIIESVMEGQSKPDVIAVTAGPGLITGLLVGVEAAKTLSYLWNVPLVGVNHIAGHIHSVLINNEQLTINKLEFPALCLIVSGGHTELILMKNHGEYELIGKTRDDAAGECFDKVAKLIGFDYPGGPHISKNATEGNPHAIDFPRPMLNEDNYDFSFAGLKTAALYWLRDHELSAIKVNPINLPAGIFGQTSEPPTLNDFCASFEQAIIDVLVSKTLKAAEQFHPKTIILAGGVAANKKLRETLESSANSMNYELRTPNLSYCMDNGAMIAVAGYYHALKNNFTPWNEMAVDPNWKVYKN